MPRRAPEAALPGRRARARRTLSLLALAMVAVSSAGAGDELRPYETTYAGIWHGMTVAVSRLRLEHTGDTWTTISNSSPRGIGRLASGVFPPRQVSVVRVTASGVLPQSFRSEGGDRAKATDLVYDWQTAARAGVRSTGHGLPAQIVRAHV